MDILDFLNGNGIIVGEENFPKKDKKKYIWDTESQISLIIEVQRILRGKKINMIPRIESSIGREMESFIVQAKRISRMIKYFEEKYNKSDFDLFIVEEGNKILNRANKSLNALNEDEYLKIIMRSMNNYDICLGRVDEGNLKKEGLAIKIRTTRYISYNMIEQDCYNYIKRLKKRGYKEDINKLVNNYNMFKFVKLIDINDGYDIFNAYCSKGGAIKYIKSITEKENIKYFAFGDGFNDLEMFDEVDYSIAMGNSCDPLKARATYITDSVHLNGIYKALRKLNLIKGE